VYTTGTTHKEDMEMAVFERIQELLSEQMNVDKEKITKTTKIVDDLKADSLDIVEMLMALEDEFSISVPDEDARGLTDIGSIVAYVESKMKK